MPLSKARMRERKRLDRLCVKPKSNPNDKPPVKPNQETLEALRERIELKSRASEVEVENLPIYNPEFHSPGDKVLVRRGKKLVAYTVPELDAGGQAIPRYW